MDLGGHELADRFGEIAPVAPQDFGKLDEPPSADRRGPSRFRRLRGAGSQSREVRSDDARSDAGKQSSKHAVAKRSLRSDGSQRSDDGVRDDGIAGEGPVGAEKTS